MPSAGETLRRKADPARRAIATRTTCATQRDRIDGAGLPPASKMCLGKVMKVDPRNAILKLLSERSADKTICPSDLMPTVHAAARALAEEGIVELRQGGERVATEGIIGPYRIADQHAN